MSIWLAVVFFTSIVDGQLLERRQIYLDKDTCEFYVAMMTKPTEWGEAGAGGCIHLKATPPVDDIARRAALSK